MSDGRPSGEHIYSRLKNQWPPVGTSSNAPKETKWRRREGLPSVIREARGYGAGCVYMHNCYPGYMSKEPCAICLEQFPEDHTDICFTCYLDL
eukprot:SAG22_NODE_2569_length_2431_cov_22.038165_4_plen_93_part_00